MLLTSTEHLAKHGEQARQARSLVYRAAVDFDLSRFDVAPQMARQALSIFESLNDRRGRAQALILLGYYDLRKGRTQEALNVLEDARRLVIDSGDFVWEVALLNNIAWAYRDLGESRSALQFFEMALTKNQMLGDRIGVAYSSWLIGGCIFLSAKCAKHCLISTVQPTPSGLCQTRKWKISCSRRWVLHTKRLVMSLRPASRWIDCSN